MAEISEKQAKHYAELVADMTSATLLLIIARDYIANTTDPGTDARAVADQIDTFLAART